MLKKIKDNNIGATSYIERTLMYLIIFCVFTFILDLILLGATMIIANHQLNYIASKLQFQSGFIGGSENSKNETQWDNDKIFEYLDSGMKSVGIDGVNQMWSLYAGQEKSSGRLDELKNPLEANKKDSSDLKDDLFNNSKYNQNKLTDAPSTMDLPTQPTPRPAPSPRPQKKAKEEKGITMQY